jgi:hypothetical protein
LVAIKKEVMLLPFSTLLWLKFIQYKAEGKWREKRERNTGNLHFYLPSLHSHHCTTSSYRFLKITSTAESCVKILVSSNLSRFQLRVLMECSKNELEVAEMKLFVRRQAPSDIHSARAHISQGHGITLPKR